MIKLTDLLKEEETFTAISKKSGETSVFKSKDSRDAAVKAGTHSDKEDDSEKEEPKGNKPNMFSKDAGYDAPDTKSDSDNSGGIEYYDSSDLEDKLSRMNLPDSTRSKVDKLVDYLNSQEYELGKAQEEEDDDAADEINNNIDIARDEIDQLLKSSKPKKDEPTKDSTKERAGNPKINKSVREKAKDLGITPQKLGKDEYERKMSQAAVEALTDSNFHSEARKLISILEDKPEWDSNPMNDPDKPKDVFSKEYDEWRKNTVFSSELYDSAEGTDEIAHLATNQSGWEGETSVDAIAFDLKMNGSKKLAAKIQSIFEGNSISKGSELISISKLVNENYKGSFSDFKYEFGMALDNIGISPKAIKKISKKGKGYEVRLSSYMSEESAWKKIGEKIGADLIDFKKGTINIGLYESTKVGQLIKEGTRSQVGVIGSNGKIISAYVHYDGYPENMKPGLKHHMKNDKDVLKLIKMGGARGIFNDKDIEYYKSGKPMKGDFKNIESYIKDADMKNGAEFVYLYNVKDKKWYYADTYKDTKLKKLF